MARMMALCSLPRTNPGNRHQYKRVNGPYKLVMIAGADNKLPYGNLPRLLVAWVCTEAVRTQSRELILGSSLSEFMGKLGMALLPRTRSLPVAHLPDLRASDSTAAHMATVVPPVRRKSGQSARQAGCPKLPH